MELQLLTTMEEERTSSKLFFFDVFLEDEHNRKIPVGIASHVGGRKTYRISLRTFIALEFFMMKEKEPSPLDYALLTREKSNRPSKKYFWHRVGYGKNLYGDKSGCLYLHFDLFPSLFLYMDLHPKDVRDVTDSGIVEE